jgi:hypothetical protein
MTVAPFSLVRPTPRERAGYSLCGLTHVANDSNRVQCCKNWVRSGNVFEAARQQQRYISCECHQYKWLLQLQLVPIWSSLEDRLGAL